ncbi:protein kinase [Streptomyces sp. NPDC058686]|uniref:serine/threonine-protein kinase n=1 Tax=Streptomyces sp. NPDC058686 TaxID=3346599 RepID=UPI00365B1A78
MGTEGEHNVRVIARRYRLEARIGRGGMGVVWRASDQLLGRRVAVKELVLDETLSADEARRQKDRALREARAVAQLSHPNVIVVHDVVEDGERPYIVMELIEGGSLADRLSRSGPVDAREAARIGIALLGALRVAHAAGVLHRDLKPANVLVEAGSERVVLTDFGIAQVSGATTLTETGSFVGSPEYTAPERMSGERTGPESDLWSLGAMLCAALTGESPFRRDSLGGIMHAVVVGEIRPPAEAEPLLPVVRGLLERDPARRLGLDEADRLLRAYVDTGTTPRAMGAYTPTARNTVRNATTGSPAAPDSAPPQKRSPRAVLAAAALVAAMAGAGVSAAALLVNGGEDGGTHRPTASAPGPTGGTGSPSDPAPEPRPTVTVTEQQTGPRPASPAGYRTAVDPKGFSLAVPDDFSRKPDGPRTFYMSPGDTFRIGIKETAPDPGGPGAVQRRSDAKGPDHNPGYRDASVTDTTHGGRPAALWRFTWNGFSTAEGARHTYDLCWEQGGRMYDVWVSAPVGRIEEAKRYFDTAVATFVPHGGG